MSLNGRLKGPAKKSYLFRDDLHVYFNPVNCCMLDNI